MNVLVTGASRGLGLAIAEHLAKLHHVTGCARQLPSRPVSFAFIERIDLTKPGDLRELSLGTYDALVNNAGIAKDSLLAIQPEEDIEEILRVNLLSTLRLTKHWVRERLAARRPGVCVNVSSIIAVRGYAGLAAYSASKAGLDGATRALARELGGKGFRFNSVLPGYLETDMSKGLTEDQRSQIVRRTPLGRLPTLAEVAAVVGFLVSEESSAVTGQCIVADCGIIV